MNEPHYEFQHSDDQFVFTFDSVSETRTLKKTVVLSLINESLSLYNLALLDKAENNGFSDLSVSNNRDMPKVLSTVFQVIKSFLNQHPTARILIEGSTPARTRLYQMAIAKYKPELEQKFLILGLIGTEFERFEHGKYYASFVISTQLNA